MGGNIVSTSYKTANTTDLEVTSPEDYSTLQSGNSQYASPNVTDVNGTPDTSIPLEERGNDMTGVVSLDDDAPWHGLPMGVDEHGSFAVINTDGPLGHHQVANNEEEPKCCPNLRDRCKIASRPLQTKHNQLPENPSRKARLKHALLCPPHGLVATVMLNVAIVVLMWAVLWAITGVDALPGGNLFALYILVVVAVIGGKLIDLVHLPALLGMLVVGFMFKNVPGFRIADDIHQGWASALRNIALAVILIKAGLGIDPGALWRLSLVCARLSTVPCILEAITVAIVSHLLINFGWDWAFMLGFIIAAVSPAVVVPSVLQLQDKGYGIRKGVPTLIVASASCENVFAIAAVGVALGIAFSPDKLASDLEESLMNTTAESTDMPYGATSDSTSNGAGAFVFDIFRAPIELLMGVAFGCVGGVFLWYIPNKNQKSLTWKRTFLVCCGGLLSLFGFAEAGFTGAGAMGCLILPFVAAQGWGRAKEPVSKIVGIIWILFEPILFGLIGAAVSLENLDGKTVGLGIAIMTIGLIVRTIVTYLVVCKAGLDAGSKVFAALAWIPKATVQAAIGPLILEVAIEKKAGSEAEQNGVIILTLAFLSIILTAPVGAILIALSGPRLLEKSLLRSDISNQNICTIPEVKIVSPEEDEMGGSQDVRGAQVQSKDGPAETSLML